MMLRGLVSNREREEIERLVARRRRVAFMFRLSYVLICSIIALLTVYIADLLSSP